MNPIFHIWRKSVTFKPRQHKARHDKAWQGKARRGKTGRRPDKKVSPGFEKYCISNRIQNHPNSTAPFFFNIAIKYMVPLEQQ